MDTRQIRTLEDPSSATPAELEEALAHWDELDASSLARLDADPEQGLRLRVLRAAESWLTECAPVESDEAGACPPAETLYEYGRGPGAEGLLRQPEVTHHIESCVSCAALVASLESAPPLPLEWTRLEDDSEELELEGHALRALTGDGADRHDGRASGPSSIALAPSAETADQVSPWFARWFPMAAAAALLVGVFLAPRFSSDSTLSRLPSHPQLRGAESTALFFPRGPVLANAGGSADPLFELAAVEGASEYRIRLFLHEGDSRGDVFDEGQRVADLRSSAPIFAATPLVSGRYTWQAFATVDELEHELGALDFEISSDDVLFSTSEPTSVEDKVERIAELHAAGYLTDARALARTLPDGPEREAYLLPPGR